MYKTKISGGKNKVLGFNPYSDLIEQKTLKKE